MSNIEWTDETWNPLVGCSKISPGCAHCYAETMGKRLRAMALADLAAGRDPGKKRAYIDAIDKNGHWTGNLIPGGLAEPFGWKKPRRVFVNSMSDLFHESVDDHFIFEVLDVCHQTSLERGHVFQILTKRAERMAEVVARWIDDGHMCGAGPFHHDQHGKRHPMPPGIWLGVSVEDQKRANERIPWLLRTPAAVRFLSCEPLLAPLDLIASGAIMATTCQCVIPWATRVCSNRKCHETGSVGAVDWVIVGGESGPKARPCNVGWIRSLVNQCRSSGVPCFVKQFGARPREWSKYAGGVDGGGADLPLCFTDKKGGDMAEWPEDLRVREFPQ